MDGNSPAIDLVAQRNYSGLTDRRQDKKRECDPEWVRAKL